MLRTLIARFFASLSALTWLPLPAFAKTGHAPCVGAYPAVGWLLGVIAALVFIFALPVWPSSLAVALALGVLVILTGGTAEAAVAASGPRGVVAVVVLQLVRLIALLELTEDTVPMAFLVALPLSQLAGVAVLFAGPSPACHSAALMHPEAASHRGRVVAAAFGLLPLFMLTPLELGEVLGAALLALLAALMLVRKRNLPAAAGFHFTALAVEVAVYVALNIAWAEPLQEVAL
ncbi:MAG: Cobalamin-5-phosphate synthase [Pseudomonadota bacterium]|jgi:adenosylcobinamide-GDP ribazoletransferase